MALCSGINTLLLLLCVEFFHGSLSFAKLQKPLNQVGESPGDSDNSNGQTALERSSPKTPNGHLPLQLFRKTLKLANLNKQSQTTREFRRENFDVSTESSCPKRCRCKYRQESRVDIVDCSSRELRAIPRLPPTARKVYLQNNSISSLPCTALREMKSLTELDLSQNRFTVLLRCSFSSLNSLERLWISNCRLSSLSIGVFESQRHLHELDLSNNNVSSIDPSVFSALGNLTWLSLRKNNIAKVLNNTFHGMGSLQSLFLQGNRLRYLPETFEAGAFQGLSSLRILHLESNQPKLVDNLTYPDQALSHIPSLQRLSLDGYPRALGPGFRSLHQLSSIIFGDYPGGFCRFQSELPADFFSNLATKQPLYLKMSSCSIKTIPPDLFKSVPTIHTLNLSSNNDLLIDGFEKGSKGLENSTLTVLDISHLVESGHGVESVIRNTTFRHLKTTSLKKLVVESCQLSQIDPRAIFDLPQTVEYISFSKNEVSQWYALLSLVRLRNLRVFKMSTDFVHRNGKGIDLLWESYNSTSGQTNASSLKHDDSIPYSRLTTKSAMFSHPPSLPGATSQVATKPFCDSPIESTKSLRDIYEDFGKIFPLPLQLEELDLNSNSFPKGNFARLTAINNKVLKRLDVSSNNLRCWGGPLYGMPSLQYLDLSKNYCSRLHPLFFSNSKSLRTLLLSQNMLGRSLSTDVDCLTFSTLIVLETLDLRSNEIYQLPQLAFKNNVNLRVLNLSHNALDKSLPNFSYNSKLEILDLSSNALPGFPKSTCKQLEDIKKSSINFTVDISGNDGFLCNCDNLYFPKFLLEHPDIFSDISSFHCQLPNGSRVSYARLEEVLPRLELKCIAQSVFDVLLVAFFVLIGIMSISGLYQYQRWKFTYLYLLGKNRLHIGSMILNYSPAAHAFVTYDQENRRLRCMMRNLILPRLNQAGVTTVLGETDFGGGLLATSIAGAVTSTGKTLVFLSPEMFQDYHRRLEVNMAIMHELEMGRPVLIPVLLLTEVQRWRRARNRRIVDDFRMFSQLTRDFPPEISAFLQGQIHRVLVYTRDDDYFWQHLKHVICDR